MDKPESKWYRQELSEELKVLRAQGAPEAAKAILIDQQQTAEYQEAEKLHSAEQQETFALKEELEKKRKEIADLKKKINEIQGGILKEEQIWGLEIFRKKYEHLIYLLYTNENRRPQIDIDSMPDTEKRMYDALQALNLPGEDVDKKQKPILAAPEKQDFENLSVEVRSENKGLYTLNPEAQDIDFDNLSVEKIKITKPAEAVSINSVLSGLSKESEKYILPGVELANYLMEIDADGKFVNQDVVDKLLVSLDQQTRFLIFPGSLVSIGSAWSVLTLSVMKGRLNVTRLQISDDYKPKLYSTVIIER